MSVFTTDLTELFMSYNGYNIILVLSSLLPLPNKDIVWGNDIINPIAFIFSKRIFKELTTFEDYYSTIASAKVLHHFYYNSLNLMFFKRRELSNTY